MPAFCSRARAHSSRYHRTRLARASSLRGSERTWPLSSRRTEASGSASSSNTSAFWWCSATVREELCNRNEALPPRTTGRPCPPEIQQGSQLTIVAPATSSFPSQTRSGRSSSPGRGPQPASIRTLKRDRRPAGGMPQVPWWQWVAMTRPLRRTSILSRASEPTTFTWILRVPVLRITLPMGAPSTRNSTRIRSPVTP